MKDIRWRAVIGWSGLVVALVLAALLRGGRGPETPLVQVLTDDGEARAVTLGALRAMPAVERRGTYQNQFGNWRDEGVYRGVLLTALLGDEPYGAVLVVAADGYRLTIERRRIVDPDYPMVLAYALDGVELPAWEDGPRIAVLPEDGAVGNEEYEAVSAGSFWVKRVATLELIPEVEPADARRR